jgi:hypothetical protein
MAAAANFLDHFKLHLLDFCKALPLPRRQVVQFFMEMANFKFGLEVDSVIVLRPQTIFGLLPFLAHHNNGRLNGREGRKN